MAEWSAYEVAKQGGQGVADALSKRRRSSSLSGDCTSVKRKREADLEQDRSKNQNEEVDRRVSPPRGKVNGMRDVIDCDVPDVPDTKESAGDVAVPSGNLDGVLVAQRES